MMNERFSKILLLPCSLCADIDASYRALMAHVRDGGLTRQEIGASDVRDANPSAAVKVS